VRDRSTATRRRTTTTITRREEEEEEEDRRRRRRRNTFFPFSSPPSLPRLCDKFLFFSANLFCCF